MVLLSDSLVFNRSVLHVLQLLTSQTPIPLSIQHCNRYRMRVIYFYICWQVSSILLRSDTDKRFAQAISFCGILHCIRPAPCYCAGCKQSSQKQQERCWQCQPGLRSPTPAVIFCLLCFIFHTPRRTLFTSSSNAIPPRARMHELASTEVTHCIQTLSLPG